MPQASDREIENPWFFAESDESHKQPQTATKHNQTMLNMKMFLKTEIPGRLKDFVKGERGTSKKERVIWSDSGRPPMTSLPRIWRRRRSRKIDPTCEF